MEGIAEKKILITGASGFIGSHLVETALNEGLTVYAGVRSTSSRSALRDPRIRFFDFDLNKPEDVATGLRKFAENTGGFTYIIHNAGITKPKRPGDFDAGNAYFTRRFAEVAVDTQPGLKKFLFMSSISALGPGSENITRPIREDHPAHPITPYGKSKLKGEQLLRELAELPYVLIRPSAVYGPRDTKMTERLLALLERRIDLRIGSAERVLSFIHVQDLARGTLRACLSPYERTAYNFSDGVAYEPSALHEMLKKHLDTRAITLRIPSWLLIGIGYASFSVRTSLGKPVHLSHYKMREVTARNWYVDISKARTELEFDPRFVLDSGVKDTVEWYSRNCSAPGVE